jgi:hypothetical protein
MDANKTHYNTIQHNTILEFGENMLEERVSLNFAPLNFKELLAEKH